jgi:hypothetical protein
MPMLEYGGESVSVRRSVAPTSIVGPRLFHGHWERAADLPNRLALGLFEGEITFPLTGQGGPPSWGTG